MTDSNEAWWKPETVIISVIVKLLYFRQDVKAFLQSISTLTPHPSLNTCES